MHMKVAVILPAAGLGTRMGKGSAEKTGTSRKQFMLLEGSPILIHTVRTRRPGNSRASISPTHSRSSARTAKSPR